MEKCYMKLNPKRMVVGWIEKLRSEERGLSKRIKRYYKYKKFEKYATVGKDLKLFSASNCVADAPGLIRIGDHCEIHGTLQSMNKGEIVIGDHTAIFSRSIVGSGQSIRIGSCVVISNQVHIYDNNNHPIDPDVRHQMCLEGFHTESWRWGNAVSKPIVIEDDVWIGENSTILKGVTIGRGSVVACCSVVTKDVPPYTIVAGNPARVVKELKHAES